MNIGLESVVFLFCLASILRNKRELISNHISKHTQYIQLHMPAFSLFFVYCGTMISFCEFLWWNARFRSFKIPAIKLIWPKSPHKHSVTRSCLSGKESGRRSESPLWPHQWRSFVFIYHAGDVKREIRFHILRLLTNQKRESTRSMG